MQDSRAITFFSASGLGHLYVLVQPKRGFSLPTMYSVRNWCSALTESFRPRLRDKGSIIFDSARQPELRNTATKSAGDDSYLLSFTIAKIRKEKWRQGCGKERRERVPSDIWFLR